MARFEARTAAEQRARPTIDITSPHEPDHEPGREPARGGFVDVGYPDDPLTSARELVANAIERVRTHRVDWDPARVLLVAAACIAVGGLAWVVLATPEHADPAVEAVQRPLIASPTSADPSAANQVAAGRGAPSPDEKGMPAAGPDTTASLRLVVDVAGAVQRPGVVSVPAGARVTDALHAAGGPTADADLARVNRAAFVVDGTRIYVPHLGEADPPTLLDPSGTPRGDAGGSPSTPAPAKVDLNTASIDELVALPGVGPATAQAIVDHRSTHGAFVTVDDLLDVRGIGEAKLAALRNRVTV